MVVDYADALAEDQTSDGKVAALRYFSHEWLLAAALIWAFGLVCLAIAVGLGTVFGAGRVVRNSEAPYLAAYLILTGLPAVLATFWISAIYMHLLFLRRRKASRQKS